jgi:hypothetical protein
MHRVPEGGAVRSEERARNEEEAVETKGRSRREAGARQPAARGVEGSKGKKQ